MVETLIPLPSADNFRGHPSNSAIFRHDTHWNLVCVGPFLLPDYIWLCGDGHGHNRDRSVIAPEFGCQLIEHCSTIADFLRRAEPPYPAVAVCVLFDRQRDLDLTTL